MSHPTGACGTPGGAASRLGAGGVHDPWADARGYLRRPQGLARGVLRHFFDTLVTRHAAPLNPFQSIRGRKHDTSDGKTPGL